MWCAIFLIVSATAVEQDYTTSPDDTSEAAFSENPTSLLQTAVSIQQLASSTDSAKGADTGEGSKQLFQRCLDLYADEVGKVDSRLGAVIRAHPGTVMATSNRTVVLGVGQKSTATRSVAKALVDLGFSTSHRQSSSPSYCQWVCKDWIAPSSYGCPQGSFSDLKESQCRAAYRNLDYTTFPDNVEAALDSPVPYIFIDLFLSFPNAKWILTTRPEEDWSKKALENKPWKTELLPVQEPCASDTVDGKTVGELTHLFVLHNEFVRCLVPPEKLFEINVWNSTDGVVYNLAKFLEVEAPAQSTPFPNVKSTEDIGIDNTCSAFTPFFIK